MTANHADADARGARAPAARRVEGREPEAQDLHPIHVPEDWHDQALLTFEQFCALIHTPARTVRDWRRRSVGPTWHKLPGTGRLYVTVAEARRFLTPARPINNARHQNQGTAR